MFITFIGLIIAVTAYNVWKINRRPSRRKIAKVMANFHAAVEAASQSKRRHDE
jgi:biopolymer transport protein ExbB/TolQ